MPCILTQCGTAGLMISELSAGCDCRLFGTGLVMSENASDCTQNAAHLDRKVKKFQPPSHAPPPLGRGTSPFSTPLPTLGRGHPYPNPTPLGASILGAYTPPRFSRFRRSTCCRPPLSLFPHLTFLATDLMITLLSSVIFKTVIVPLHGGRLVVVHSIFKFFYGPLRGKFVPKITIFGDFVGCNPTFLKQQW